MYKIRILLLSLLSFTFISCSSISIEDFNGKKPDFDFLNFFQGDVEAWGIIEDRFGNLKRQFKVEMFGKMDNGVLIVEEDFYYSDGEKDRRIWKFNKFSEKNYNGIANDIIGTALGKEEGNAFNMSYQMDLDIGLMELRVTFDDWMYRIDKNTVINKASISKYGLNIANITLFFYKKD